jgi:hypothetical protein
MLTLNGNMISPDGLNGLTPREIGTALGRVPRFGGHTNRYWTVLHHSFVVEVLWGMISRGWDRATLDIGYESPVQMLTSLHALLHDAHEAVTGDIPTDWKTEDMRAQQRDLDRRIFRALGLSQPGEEISRIIKEMDARALRAEAYVVGSRGFRGRQGWATSSVDVGVVRHIAAAFKRPEATDGPHSLGVEIFTNQVSRRLEALKVLKVLL